MKILAIETSCDETAVCIVKADGEDIRVLGNELYSQAALHAQYGGVFPNMAKREHAKNLVPLLAKCLADAKCGGESRAIPGETKEKIKIILEREGNLADDLLIFAEKSVRPDIDAIAVTNGPGLEPALWVGVTFAKSLGILWDMPVYPINHLEGHILVAAIERIAENGFAFKEIEYPAIALLVSGGHTQIVLNKAPLAYKIVGDTKDDAAGEAFDKVARILGLPYPGGPEISRLAKKDREEFPDQETMYPLPRPMIRSGDLDFSFSGLKTAVLYTVKKIPKMTDATRQEIAREFEDAAIEVLVLKTRQAAIEYGAKTIVMGGGVSANAKLRSDLAKLAEELSAAFLVPEVSASTDNALMIGVAAAVRIAHSAKPAADFRAEGNLSLS